MELRVNHRDDIQKIIETLDIDMDGANVIGYHSEHGIGVVALKNYFINQDIELFVVGSGSWLNKQLLKHIFTYIFTMLNCIRCTARIKNDNTKSIELVKRLGFVKEGELRGVDISIFSLLRSDCKWAVNQKVT